MMTNKVPDRIREDFKFLKGWMKQPGHVGAITPTSKITARHMASLIPRENGLPVLELGPGTGVITGELLKLGFPAERLVSIEYGLDFYNYLIPRFPGVNFIHGDALDIDTVLSRYPGQLFAGVIGAIPLLNLPKSARMELVDKYLDRIAPNGPFVQITYGPKPPVPAMPGRFTVKKSKRILRNIPPATIWVYQKEAN